MSRMESNQIVDTWMLFKEYLEKKQIELVAEKFVDMLADYGVEEEQLMDALGSDSVLDEAIRYYLDIDDNIKDYDEFDDEDY